MVEVIENKILAYNIIHHFIAANKFMSVFPN